MNLSSSPTRTARLLILLAAFQGICIPSSSSAVEEHIPFFAGRFGVPNVMIIFDNSDSMQESPYLRDDGITPYRPNMQQWQSGIETRDCGTTKCIKDDTPDVGNANGTIQFNSDAHSTPDDESFSLPTKIPPHLPGLDSSSSEATSIGTVVCPTGIPAGSVCARIDDANITSSAWGSLTDSIFNATYKGWQVEVKDFTNKTRQVRTLAGYSNGTSAQYWIVSGGPLAYDSTHRYTYRLLGSIPGKVTASNGTNRVYDSNIDWTLFSSSFWKLQYIGHELEVTAGTNSGQKKKITSVYPAEGYWEVESFTVPCDTTSRYRILVGTGDDAKLAFGADHPDSKMYQAKDALRKFLDSDTIKTCDHFDEDGKCIDYRYQMNFGFATFMQAVVPRTTALYYRVQVGRSYPVSITWKYRQNQSIVKKFYDLDGRTDGKVDFDDERGNRRTGIDIGYVYTQKEYEGGCSEQTVALKVTSITPAPTDTNPERLEIKVESDASWTDLSDLPEEAKDPEGNPRWGWTIYDWLSYSPVEQVATCAEVTPPDFPGWTLVKYGENCYEPCRYYGPSKEPDSTTVRPYDIYGNETVTQTYSTGYVMGGYLNDGYINKNTVHLDDPKVIPPKQIDVDSRVYTLVENTIKVPDGGGGERTITEEIFDSSPSVYPAAGSGDHPHGWSYKTTSVHKMYEKGYPPEYVSIMGTNLLSTWKDTEQTDTKKPSYFPSISGRPGFSNYSGDDQTAFVDLPSYNASAADYGDDLDGDNIQKIKNMINLDRTEYAGNKWRKENGATELVCTNAPCNPRSLTVNVADTAGNGTPLAATLKDAKKYFESYMAQDYDGGKCRKNYIILLTDGLETADLPVLRDGIWVPAAEAAAKDLQELKSSTGVATPVKVYVIGFGLDASSKVSLDNLAKAGGTRIAYFANNTDDLVGILTGDIAKDILSGSFARANVTLSPLKREDKSKLYAYFGYFDFPEWAGHLMSYNLDPVTGAIGEQSPHWSKNCTHGLADAGCIMAEDYPTPPGNATEIMRTLYTSIPNTDGKLVRQYFSQNTEADWKSLVNPDGLDIDQDETADTEADAIEVINFVRHPGYKEGKYKGTRNPDSPLAAIYNSAPKLVSPPFQNLCKDYDNDPTTPITWGSKDEVPGYCKHYTDHQSRESMLYVGTNGGMIEAIVADGRTEGAQDGGYEKWGYVPNNVLGKLHELKDGFRFTMDLTISAAEVDISGSDTQSLDGTGWRTMLVAGQRQGGNYYTALDVTNPSIPVPMWEFTDPNLGQTWSPPSFGRIMINGVITSVVFFGGGYSPDENVGNRIFIVRASDGTILKELEVGTAENNVPGGLRSMAYLTDSYGNVVDYRTNLPQRPDATPVDSDLKYCIEAVYFGDTNGSIWRLDNLNNKAGTWDDLVTLTKIYTPPAGKGRPIYYRPVVRDIKDGSISSSGEMTGCVKRYILAGTGDENNPNETEQSGKPILDYVFQIEELYLKPDTPPATLNWRLTLGLRLPKNEAGEVLNLSGTKIDGCTTVADRLQYLWLTDDNGGVIQNTGENCSINTTQYFDDAGKLIESVPNKVGKILEAPGEKVLSELAFQSPNISFTSYSPSGSCTTGRSFLYEIRTSDCQNLSGKVERLEELEGKSVTGVTYGGKYLYFAGGSPVNDDSGYEGKDDGLEFGGVPANLDNAKILYWRQE